MGQAATFFKVKSLFTPLFKINGLEELDVSCSGVLCVLSCPPVLPPPVRRSLLTRTLLYWYGHIYKYNWR